MKKLKPGARYVYERENGILYATEYGKPVTTRVEIAWDYNPDSEDGRPWNDNTDDLKMWRDIILMSKKNPGLRTVLEEAILIYKLSK